MADSMVSVKLRNENNSNVNSNVLKIAEVISIFKKGDANKTTNYRPMSVSSQFNKSFEKLLYRLLDCILISLNITYRVINNLSSEKTLL